MEQTYVMVKPDGVQRGLVGRVIQKFEDKGLQLVGLRMRWPNQELLKEHYAALADKPFFDDLLDYVGSGPVVCMCWRGREAVKEARRLIGATDPCQAAMGSIRGDLGQVAGRNLIHGADSVASAAREIALWFSDGEDLVCNWSSALQPWLLDH